MWHEFKDCDDCYLKEQNEDERDEINAVSFPDGFITTWNSKPAFLDKKHNYMYFRIPENQRIFFDPIKTYQIIIRESI